MNSLYPYQVQAVNDTRRGWLDHKRQLLVMPTGSGKTFTFAEMARLASNKGRTILVLTHREELFNQTHKSFGALGIVPHKINQDHEPPQHAKGVFIVMVETLARREHLISSLRPDLIIIDEAHYGNFSKIIERFPDVYTLGVTATPIGKHFFKYYTNIVQPIDIPELIEKGFLVPYKAYQMVDNIEGLKVGASGDYTEKSQFTHFNKDKLYKGVVDEWVKRCSGKKTVVFNCNVEHSDQMAQEFNAKGIKSYSLTSKTSSEDRMRILDEFENGDCYVLNNVGILTAGYDHPPIECIVLNLATTSLAKYLQMNGRGSRTFPGKSMFTTLDFGGNHSKHGLWSQPRKWVLGEKKPKLKTGEAVVKDCPECEAMLSASLMICPYCGHQFPVAVVSLKDGTMEEYFEEDIPNKSITECTPQDFVILVRTGKIPLKKAVGFIRRTKDESEAVKGLAEFAKAMGYNYGWVNMQMKFRPKPKLKEE